MLNLKKFSSTLINSVSTDIIKSLACVSSNGDRMVEIDNRIAEINTILNDHQKKLQFIDFGTKSGMLEQSKLDELNQQIESQAVEITNLQAEKIALNTEMAKLISDSKGNYKLFDSHLRDASTCGEKSTPVAYKVKQSMLTLIGAIIELDDDDLENVSDNDAELGIKAAISQYYTQTSGKSGRYTYIRKYNLEDDTDAVKKSIDEKLGTIVNPLR